MCDLETLGIIGYGQFGRLAASLAPEGVSVRVYDPAPLDQDTAEQVEIVSLESACAADCILICVPIQAMRGVISGMVPHVRPGSWVIDVASVKTLPATWMAKGFGPDVALTATHPLFGPQSAKRGLAGQKLAVCPIRGGREDSLISFAQSLGLQVVLTDPDTHDREMAYVQALTHLIGRSLLSTELPDVELKTQSYSHLVELCDLIRYDSLELFNAIQSYNPHAETTAQTIVTEMTRLLKEAKPD